MLSNRLPAISVSHIVLLAIVCIATFFVNNQVIMPDIMESRNIITAREMVDDGHWIVTTMNGDLRLEKPPLPTWLTAVAQIVSPDSIALQRAMAGLAAVMLVLFFYAFARSVLRIDPLIPTLLLCTCYNIILMGRTASWDIYCHAFMMGAIYMLARALSASGCRWWLWIGAGVMTGLSIMSKGPVSLYALLLPFVIAYGIVYTPSLRGKGWGIAVMTLIAIVIGTWWYAYIYLFHGDELMAVVHKESGSWINHNVRPWYYYWKFFLETGVWSLLLITAIVLPLCNRVRRNTPGYLFALLWMVFSLILLSLLPEKKSRYLLPLLIPASYVMGWLVAWWCADFRHTCARRADSVLFRLNSRLIALAVAAIPFAAYKWVYMPGYIPLAVYIALSVFAVGIAVWLFYAAARLQPMSMLWAVTVLFLVAEIAGLPFLTNVINNPDMHSVALTRQDSRLDGVPFYHDAREPLRIELVYAAHRHIRPLDLTRCDSLQAAAPCAILTHGPLADYVSPDCLSKFEIVPVGTFDDNRRGRDNRRYSRDFIYDITLLLPRRQPLSYVTTSEDGK